MSKFDYERTFGELEELSDPEVVASIRELSRPRPVVVEPYKPIRNLFYLLWLVGSAFGIFVAFFLGSLVYR
jgi:hypothetical protein